MTANDDSMPVMPAPVLPLEMPHPIGVYVSASSAETERAKKMMDALREKGIPVRSTWIENVAANGGVANPRDASVEDRQKWSLQDVREAISSQIFWLLMPSGPHSFGAAFEMGFFTALANDAMQGCIVSGDYKRTIFTSFAECFDTDEEALNEIVAAFEQLKAEAAGQAQPSISFNPNATPTPTP